MKAYVNTPKSILMKVVEQKVKSVITFVVKCLMLQ